VVASGRSAVVAALALAGCGSGGTEPPLRGFTATLDRDVRRLPGGRIVWSTEWRLCWAPRAGALAYEVQTLTGEGASGNTARQAGRCLELEVAANENRRAEGYRDERVQVALAASQLAYRVRAVLADGRFTPWSGAYPAGEPR
jgi:hypothetical protein